jgi:F-type H+-transporting ATPase subunit b
MSHNLVLFGRAAGASPAGRRVRRSTEATGDFSTRGLASAVYLLEACGAHLAISLLAPSFLLAAEAEKGAHGGGSPDLLVPPSVWAIVSFLIVLTILLKKLLPPIIQVMDKRAREISEALEAAEKARDERRALAESHAAEMRKAQEEVMALIEQGKADAVKLKDYILTDARRESEEVAARARREIEQAKQASIDELQRRAVSLALDLAGQVIKKELRPEDHQALIQERIRDLPSA